MLKSHRVSLTVVVAIFIGVLAGLIIASNFDWTEKSQALDTHESKPEVALGSSEPVSQELMDLQHTSNAFVQIAKEVSPAVVTITSESVVKLQHPFSQMFPEEFRRFFSVPEQDMIRQGLGSGVIVNPEGYVLTNHHVISDADEINVLIDDESYPAEVVGSDSKTDIAVIKIDVENLPTVKFGDSDELQVGEWVLAIGSPIAQILENTVTAGIVSAKGRSRLNIGGGEIAYQDFIQTDAAINPGNSGGALVNLRGELIGINTAIVGQANIGIGFAIPINLAKWVMDQLISEGKVTRGWLGVRIQSLNSAMAESFGLDKPTGALVIEVTDDGPAEKAGVQVSDIILEVNGDEIESSDELARVIASYKPGTRVEILLLRKNKTKTITVKLDRFPDEEGEDKEGADSSAATKIGIHVQNITDEMARRLDLEDREGVIISEVERRSVAAKEGLRKGDIILEVNQQPVQSAREFRQIVKATEEGDTLLLYMKRGERRFFAGLRVPAKK
jgi:serine protease Do